MTYTQLQQVEVWKNSRASAQVLISAHLNAFATKNSTVAVYSCLNLSLIIVPRQVRYRDTVTFAVNEAKVNQCFRGLC
jgi:hypothetical protein